ncbi:tetratricopeptide repeat protein [Oxobacter pfennigii]|uniref:Tetratricopeptide repeat protein n=1 Tax=Oxobacter pfennigii TaxID=36849 RepID=A0A0P9AFN9_9CLOT|nr:helix-turn-helix transcriptional regulator [Oxobacter pfennigii]KPU44174.1 tetratricopeptide repeat protein [Oxobacter pfennigii]
MEILTLGNKIKNRRKELELTLKDLAGDRVTPAQLSYVETDKCKPSLDLLEYIAEKLGLEMDYLLESEKKQVSRFCEYNIKLSNIDILQGNFKEAKNRILLVLETAKPYNLNEYIGEAEKCLGLVYKNLSDYDNANRYFLSALHKFSQINSTTKIIETYIELGLVAYQKNYYSSALGYMRQAERVAENLEEIQAMLELKLLYYLMILYAQENDVEKSVLYAEKVTEALELYRDKKRFGNKLLEMGRAFEKQNKYEKAMEYVQASSCVYDGMDNMDFIAKIQTDIGKVYTMNSVLEKSYNYLCKSLEIKKAMEDTSIPLTLIEISNNHILKKDFDKALEIINEALNMSIIAGNREYEALAYRHLFKAYIAKGDYIKAEESIRRSADILESIEYNKELAGCYIDMSEFYKRINREKDAVEYIAKAIELYRVH